VTRQDRTTRKVDANPAEPGDILASIGLVPYDWHLDSDTLTWGANAADVLQVPELARIATGRGYAALLDPKNVSTRYDAVMQEGARDYGAGVPYEAEY